MRPTKLAALLLLAGGVAGAAAPAARAQDASLYRSEQRAGRADPYEREGGEYAYDQQDQRYDPDRLSVRVWLDRERDIFRPGDYSRVLVRASEDAYVAVLNITPDGDVEVLWPRDYYDDGYMRQGTHAVSTRNGGSLRFASGYGLGYVMAVASDEPLELRNLRSYFYRSSYGWDASLNVYGDPFRAMERLAGQLVPGYEDGYGAVDWYSYSVGSTRYSYPRYACYDGYGAWYSSRNSYYSGCDRVRVLLREVPYYYDTRSYRGDRSRYWRRWYNDERYVRRDPQHGYKERGYGYNRAGASPNRRSFGAPPTRSGGSGMRTGGDGQEGEGRAQPSTRQRPTLQRRPPETEPVRVRPQYAPQQREEPRNEPRTRDYPVERSEPRVREAPPERSEPRSREPSPRSEPRVREAPPARAEPRSEPRAAPPSRDAGSSRQPSESPRVRPPSQ